MNIKSIILCLALIIVSFSKPATAQFVTIPDSNFVNWLNGNGYSQCMNGNQLDTTCNAVQNSTSLNCKNAGINDLTGVHYFKMLQDIDCSINYLTALPILPQNLVT